MIARGMDEIMNDKAHVSSMPLLGRTTDAPLWRDRRLRSFGKTLHIIFYFPDGLVKRPRVGPSFTPMR